MHSVCLDLDSLFPDDLDLSRLRNAVGSWQSYGETRPEQIVARAQSAQLLICNKTRLDAATLRQLSALRLICVTATGVNNIDLDAARALSITVCNARHYATASVVQHVFALLLALQQHLPGYQQAVAQGAWQNSPHFCLLTHRFYELAGKALGIVGYGVLGQAVAALAKAFGMRVLIAQRSGAPVQAGRLPLHTLLAQVDVLSLHCPLTPETQGLIGAAELALMRPHALLINTARGGIVDEAALAQALRSRQIGGAGVDVLSEEPPRPGNPLLYADIPNLIVTPHIAWASHEARQRLIDEVTENIRSFCAGQARNMV